MLSKKIYVSFYKAKNFGDDLFLHILLSKFKNYNFIIYADSSYRDFVKNYPNLENARNLMTRLANRFCNIEYYISTRCMASVFIGGSMFIEPFFPKIDTKNPLFILGSNFGPYRTKKYFLDCKKLFSSAYDVCFRDRYTYSLFSDLNNVRYAPDIAFSLPIRANTNGKGCFISVINYAKENKKLYSTQEKYEDFIFNIVRYYCKKDKKVILASFSSKEGDNTVVERILKRVPQSEKKNIIISTYSGNISEIISQISNCSTVIGTRFHSIVMGLSAGKKVLPICYSQKTKNMLNDLGLSKYGININQLSKIDFNEKILCLLTPEQIGSLREKSERHFYKLSTFLSSR